MKKFLIIEDDNYKSEAILNIINKERSDSVVELAENVSSAIRLINSNVYDLIFLDMALPSHPVAAGGGSPLSLLSGGLEVLFELKTLKRKDRCLIVTQFPEIGMNGRLIPLKDAPNEILKYYGCDVITCIYYSNDSNEWQENIRKIIGNI